MLYQNKTKTKHSSPTFYAFYLLLIFFEVFIVNIDLTGCFN